jgi:hypothetical protein
MAKHINFKIKLIELHTAILTSEQSWFGFNAKKKNHAFKRLDFLKHFDKFKTRTSSVWIQSCDSAFHEK